MEVDDINDTRFAVALELLQEGHAMKFNNVSFSLIKTENKLLVAAVRSWYNNLTRERAILDIQRGVSTFEYLEANSPNFAQLLGGISIRFSLIEDYGMGCVELAHLSGGEFVWN